MIRYIAAILCVVAILTGCNSKPGRDKEPVITYVERSDSESEFETSLPEPIKEYAPGQEILNAGMYDNLVQIGDSVLTLPTSYSALIEIGAQLIDSNISEDYLVDPEETKSARMALEGQEFNVIFFNRSLQRSSLRDTVAVSVDSQARSFIFYPKGIHVGSSLEELERDWGEPTEDNSQGNDVLYFTFIEYTMDAKKLLEAFDPRYSETLSLTENEYGVTIDRNTSELIKISRDFNKNTPIQINQHVKDSIWGASGKQINLFYELPSHYTYGIPLLSSRAIQGEKAPSEVVGLITHNEVPCASYIETLTSNSFQIHLSKETSISEKTVIDTVVTSLENQIKNLRGSKESEQYNIQTTLVKSSDNEVSAIAMAIYKDRVLCETLYMTSDWMISTHGSKLLPVTEGQEIPEAAIDEFQKDVENILKSYRIEDVQD